ncbi:MAG: hypothetical protein ACREEM_49800 [Blastocatellia bacterium]
MNDSRREAITKTGMLERLKPRFATPYLWLIRLIGAIVPQRLRVDWRQEWEADLRCRETLLAEWDNLNWKTKLDLLRRSLGAFRDALLLQPRRLEEEMFQDLRIGLRVLVAQPGFTLIAVSALALGIGATTLIFKNCSSRLCRPMCGSGYALPEAPGSFIGATPRRFVALELDETSPQPGVRRWLAA